MMFRIHLFLIDFIILWDSSYFLSIYDYIVKKPSGWFMKEFPQSDDKSELYPFLMLFTTPKYSFSLTFIPIYKDNFMGRL